LHERLTVFGIVGSTADPSPKQNIRSDR